MPFYRSVLSLEYVRVRVDATEFGVDVNPITDDVKFAFPIFGEAPSSWTDGSWETNVVTGAIYARFLLGPGGALALTAGRYDAWLKIGDNPEIPVRRVDELVMF